MKVFFGLNNVHFALATEQNGTVTYGTPHKHPGAVNMTLEPSGSETPFYADNIVYYSASSNQGYSGTLEMAMFDEWFLQNVLGQEKDSDGVLIENAQAPTKYVAMLYEVSSDAKAARRVLYYLKPERPNETAATKGETTEPQTTTINFTASPLPSTMDIKASTTEDTASAAYDNWFNEVHLRNGAATPDATLESLTLGAVTLDPVFASETTEYTATTTNATNTINAVATDSAATVTIKLNGSVVQNGSSLTWEDSSNTVAVEVVNGAAQKTYTITVTKS